MIRWLVPFAGTLLLLVAAGLAVLGAAATVQRGHAPRGQSAAPALPAPRTAEAAPLLPAPRPAVYFAAITDRPLFAPTRRPATAPQLAAPVAAVAPQPAAIPEEAPDLRLLGTMVMGERASALLAIGDQPQGWIPVGTAVAGFTVTSVGPDWVELASIASTLRLDLYPK